VKQSGRRAWITLIRGNASMRPMIPPAPCMFACPTGIFVICGERPTIGTTSLLRSFIRKIAGSRWIKTIGCT
jgi:hypothetical protein